MPILNTCTNLFIDLLQLLPLIMYFTYIGNHRNNII